MVDFDNIKAIVAVLERVFQDLIDIIQNVYHNVYKGEQDFGADTDAHASDDYTRYDK